MRNDARHRLQRLAAAGAAAGSAGASRHDGFRWGSEPSFGGGGTAKVGPGWGDAPRFDAGEIELLIEGTRCHQNERGEWLTETGEPCQGVEQ